MLARVTGIFSILFIGLAPAFAQMDVVPVTVLIPAGDFIYGSDQAERDYGYRLDAAAYGHSRTRDWGWYDHEPPRQQRFLPAYEITLTPITNVQYAAFVDATDHPVPDVDPETWESYNLIHPYARTRRHAWTKGTFPEGRSTHPVVMVSYHDALAYAAWLSAKTGDLWRLPNAPEWEKAARGAEGHIFPWGDVFDPSMLNSHDTGPFDTVQVGRFPKGASPYGVLDMAGNVFEWTSSEFRNRGHMVKGGSWDDSGCGVCRSAARHGRPDGIKHILVGFRLVKDPSP